MTTEELIQKLVTVLKERSDNPEVVLYDSEHDNYVFLKDIHFQEEDKHIQDLDRDDLIILSGD